MGTKIRSGGRFFINGKDGGVANGWKVETFNAGSAGVLGTDNKATYTDYTLGTSQTNPIVLNERGEAEVWWNGTYLIKVYDESDNFIYSLDYFGQGEDTSTEDAQAVPLNGSFETDTNADGTPDNWSLTPGTNGTIATNTADSAKGLTSLKFTGTDATGGGVATSDKFDVLKSDSASVTFSYISSAVNTLNKIDINWYNSADTLLTTDSVLSEGAANPTSWTSYVVAVTAPATAVRATLTLTGVDGSGTTTAGNTWFDTILYESTSNKILTSPVIEGTITGRSNISTFSTATVGFLLDGMYDEFYTDVAPMFESYGYKCGFALFNTLGTSGLMTLDQVLSLSNRGFEFADHTWSHLALDGNVDDAKGKAEIYLSKDLFRKWGFKPNTFVASASVVQPQWYSLIEENYKYAFTQTPTASYTAMRQPDPHRLTRISIENGVTTLANAKLAIDDAYDNGGTVIFYCHAAATASYEYVMMTDLLDYCDAQGVNVETPEKALSVCVRSKNIPEVVYEDNGIIFSDRTKFGSVSANISGVAVNASNYIVVTATGTGQALVSATIAFEPNDEMTTAISNFSGALASGTATFDELNYVGLDFLNAGGTSLISGPIQNKIGTIDTSYRRYSTHLEVPVGTKQVLMYFKIDFTSAGTAIIRSPILRMGRSVAEIDQLYSHMNAYSATYTNATAITAGTTQVIPLDAQASNGLFVIASNTITFLRQARLLITNYITSSTALTLSTGGILRAAINGNNVDSQLDVTSTTFEGGSMTLSIDVQTGDTLVLSMHIVGASFTVDGSSSILNIIEN